jgi:MoxR-like ATPase
MIIEMRKAVRKITVNDKISNYIVRVVSSTRGHGQVKLGCSPRAALFLMKASQARAFMEGRTFVTPDDAKQLAVPVLAHRLVLNQAARLKGIPNSEIINEILDDTPIQIK